MSEQLVTSWRQAVGVARKPGSLAFRMRVLQVDPLCGELLEAFQTGTCTKYGWVVSYIATRPLADFTAQFEPYTDFRVLPADLAKVVS